MLAALWTAGSVLAQDYPARPVRIIVPFEMGGTLDAIARNLTPRLTEGWGQQVIVENRAGARRADRVDQKGGGDVREAGEANRPQATIAL